MGRLVRRWARRSGGATSTSGFTVVEMAVSVAVLGVVLSMAMGFFGQALTRGSEVSESTQLQNESRQVLDQLVRELRQANSGSSSVAAILTMTGTTLTFLSPDSSTPYRMRKISYQVSGNSLQRASVLSTDTDGYPWLGIDTLPAYTPVLGSVRNASPFSYLDDAGSPTTTASAVHTVLVSIDIDPYPSSGAPAYTYSVGVHPRSAT